MDENILDDIPMDPSPTSIIKPIIKGIAPIGIEAVKMFFTGKRIMICGPVGAGKSNFKDYFIYDLLLPEMKESDREPTFDFETAKRKLVKYGKENNFSLRIKKFIDSPGELDPRYQVQKLEKQKPDCLLIYLDCSSFNVDEDNSISIRWFKGFASYLKNALTRNSKLNKKLKSITIVLNKYDKIKAEDFERFIIQVENIRDQYFNDIYISYQYKKRNIPIFKCISIAHKDSKKYLNHIINSLISRMK